MSGSKMVSIILPAYNAEKYIVDCLESVLKQSYKNWELLIINDGSNDKTREICSDYILQDKRIKLLDINNKGVSVARNIGLDNSVGQFIMFLDSDDWLEENALEYAVKQIENLNSDILCWNHIIETIRGCDFNKSFSEEKITFSHTEKTDLCYHIIQNNWKIKDKDQYLGMIRCVWGKLYRRCVIDDIRFSPGMNLAEDALFNYQTFKRANYISFVNEYLIHYRITGNSANNRYRPEMKKDLQCTLSQFKKLIGSKKNQDSICVYNALVCEFFHYYMTKYIVRKENKSSLFVKYKDIKEILTCDEIIIANKKCRYLSLQDRIILSCIIRRKAALLLTMYFLRYLFK